MPSAGEGLAKQARRLARRREVRGRKAVLFGASVVAAQVKHELEQHGVTGLRVRAQRDLIRHGP